MCFEVNNNNKNGRVVITAYLKHIYTNILKMFGDCDEKTGALDCKYNV